MRLSVAEAAARLEISPRAVRDRLQRGELKGELVSARSGATWLVDWTGEADEENADLVDLICGAVIESVGETMRETVAPLVARADELARENEQLRAQVAALEIAADEAETDDSAADVEPGEASRRWWKR